MNTDVYKAPDFFAKQKGQELILLVIKNNLTYVVAKGPMGLTASYHGLVENNWMAKDIMQDDPIDRGELPEEINNTIDELPEFESSIQAPTKDPRLN